MTLERDDAVARPKREPGEAVWALVGAQLASMLLSAGVAALLDAIVYPRGHVRLHYRIDR